jgi:hypothetical protein
MKLIDTLLLASATAFFAIGIYEAMVLGMGQAYSIFMVCLVLLFIYGYRKNKQENKK